MRLLIDADSIVYGAGFSAARTLPDGSKDPGPLQFSLQAVRQSLGSIEYEVSERLKRGGDKITDFSVFLTGKNNYRDKLATIRPYKGNRDKTHKPVWYEEMRAYLVDKWGALVVHGREADDAVASAQCQAEYESTMICSIDKDLKTVPGLLYNFRKKSLDIISPLQAKRAFWTQVLTGDATDNIGGCYKVGPKGAKDILSPIKTVIVEEYERLATDAVIEAYAQSMERYGDVYNGHDPVMAVLENCQLLHMQEYPDQLWGFNGKHKSVRDFLEILAGKEQREKV